MFRHKDWNSSKIYIFPRTQNKAISYNKRVALLFGYIGLGVANCINHHRLGHKISYAKMCYPHFFSSWILILRKKKLNICT